MATDSAVSPPPLPSANPAALGPSASDEISAPRGAPCPKCGSLVEAGEKFCHACGTAQVVAPPTAPTVQQKRFQCKNCGAQVTVDPSQRSYTCPFCDSTYVIEIPAAQSDHRRPEFVIGFAVTQTAAIEKFQTWLTQSGWFRPGDLTTAQISDKLRGVYLPFWSFSMLAESRWSAKIGEYWYRTETYTVTEDGKSVTKTRQVQETEWWPLSGLHHNYYSGFLVSGSKGLPQQEAERLKPFHLPALKRYEPSYLAGWLSEEYSVAAEQALEVCKQQFNQWEQQSIKQFLPGDTQSGLSAQTEFSDVSSDLILLPVFLLSYRYKDKLFRFLVNGQTGHMVGDKPLSWIRIAIAIAGGVLAVLMLFLFFRLLKH